MDKFTTEQLTWLRDLLVQRCTLEELQIFCADLDEDVQNVVPQNATKLGAAQNLVGYFHRRERLGELIARVMKDFPNADWGTLAHKAIADHAQNSSVRLAILFAAPLIDEVGNQRHPIEQLDFEGERDLLFKSLSAAGRALNISVNAATVENLQRQTTLGCRAVHYSGHGAIDFLQFEGLHGMTHALSNADLKELIAASANTDLRLAFVSACHSRRAGEAFVAAGVPHVVAVRASKAVEDKAAMRFAQQFYLAVLANKTVRQAFEIGCQAVANDPELTQQGVADDERDKFLLLPETGDHDRTVFEDVPHGALNWQQPAPLTNIVGGTEHFVGRSDDLQRVLAALSNHRLVTLSGFGGIGKTTLAREAGRYLHQRHVFADGVWFIEARNAKTPESLRVQITEQLQVQANDDASFFRALRNKKVLLVLDNCEDPLNADGKAFRAFLEHLLKASADIKLVVTSRQPVGKVGTFAEQVFAVKRLSPQAAAQLFLASTPDDQRKATAQAIDSAAAKAVLDFLDGHPNAILLVAALLAHQSLPELAHEIEQREHAVLIDPNIPPDERDALTSMTVSLDISTSQLRAAAPDAARLFGVLGLLPGGALPPDLDAIWGANWKTHLDELVRRNLVQHTRVSETQQHYTTFPFVTSYAFGLLDAPALTEYADRAAQHYAEMAEQAYASLRKDRSDLGRLLSFEEENMVACLALNRVTMSQPVGVIYPTLLSWFASTFRIEEGLVLGDAGLLTCRKDQDRLSEANTLKELGNLNVRANLLDTARQNYGAALPIFREIQDRLGEADTLAELGSLNMSTGEISDAHQNLEAALCLYRKIQDRQRDEANVLNELGYLWLIAEELGYITGVIEVNVAAVAAWWQARDLFRAIGDVSRTTLLDNMFVDVEQSEEWSTLITDLQANAENIRQAAVAQLRQQMQAQGNAGNASNEGE